MDKQSSLRRLAPLLLIAALALLIPVIVSAQGQPPTIPHPVEGRDACLACHADGIAGAPQVPANHEGRTDDVCRACHQVASTDQSAPAATATAAVGESPTAEVTEPPTAEPATPTTEPAATAEVTTSPAAPGALPIPHSLEGRENCLECHVSAEVRHRDCWRAASDPALAGWARRLPGLPSGRSRRRAQNSGRSRGPHQRHLPELPSAQPDYRCTYSDAAE